jgi:hypothetical protein
MLTAAPGTPTVGANPVMVGGPVDPVTVNAAPLVAEPAGAVTPISPEVAPVGTVTTSCVAVADVTGAAVPLNVTVFWLAVELNPVPEIVTVVPTGPLEGVNSMIVTTAALWREIDSRLPTGS